MAQMAQRVQRVQRLTHANLLCRVEEPIHRRGAQPFPRHVAQPDARLPLGETLDAVHAGGPGETRQLDRPRAIGWAVGKPHWVAEASRRVENVVRQDTPQVAMHDKEVPGRRRAGTAAVTAAAAAGRNATRTRGADRRTPRLRHASRWKERGRQHFCAAGVNCGLKKPGTRPN